MAEIGEDAAEERMAALYLTTAWPCRILFQVMEAQPQPNGFDPEKDALPILGQLLQVMRGDDIVLLGAAKLAGPAQVQQRPGLIDDGLKARHLLQVGLLAGRVSAETLAADEQSVGDGLRTVEVQSADQCCVLSRRSRQSSGPQQACTTVQ